MANGFTNEWLNERLNRMSPARVIEKRGIPLLDALIALPVEVGSAVESGQEIALHMEIIKECRLRGWAYEYKNPTKRTTGTVGIPDFIIWADAGRVLNVECKTKTGVLSKDQVKFRDAITAKGHEYHVVKSLARFVQIANRQGAKDTKK